MPPSPLPSLPASASDPTLAWELLEEAPMAVHVLDADGRVLWANRAAQALSGRAPGDLLGVPFWRLWADPQPGEALVRRVLAGEGVDDIEAELLRPDGSRRTAQLSLALRAAPGGGAPTVRCYARDVSARRDADALNAAIIEAALDPILLMDDRGRVVEFNRAAVDAFGYARDEAVGRPLADLIIPERLREAHWQGLARFLRDGTGPILGKRLEMPAMRRGGEEFPCELTVVPIRRGGRIGFAGHLRDITERKRIEQALRDSAERLRWLIENTSEAVFRFELDQPIRVDLPEEEQIELMYRHGWLADANESMARQYGFESVSQMIGMRVGDILVREDPRNLEFLRAFVRSGYRIIDVESVDMGRDGRVHYVLNSMVGEVRDGLGLRAWGTSRDITERKHVELALRESEERLRLALAAADLGVWDYDASSGTARASDRAREILGIPPGAPLGHDLLLIGAEPDDRGRAARAIERSLDPSGSGDLTLEFRVRQPDGGEARWVAARGKALFDAQGRATRFVGTVLDISARRAIQEALTEKTRELTKANAELGRSNAELEQFAYVASHDLQEPLRMVVNYLNLLQRRHGHEISGKAVEFVQEAVDGARRMQALVRALLDYSRVGASWSPAPCDPAQALDIALANLEDKIQAAGATIRRSPLPMVLADPVLLAQVFQNLVGNAIKFAREAPVVEIRGETRDGERVIAVQDNGIGIDEQHHAGLFQIFRRLHTRDEYPGTGIGLATVKKIVERHGGRVWLESAPGQGTTFFFSLPGA